MAKVCAGDHSSVAPIDAVVRILEVICRITGMGFAVVGRVTNNRWIVWAVRDELAIGIRPGDALPLAETLCGGVREQGIPIVIDHVAQDSRYRDHSAPKRFGFQSYISVPIRRKDGAIFGTLCAVDPRPMPLDRPETIDTFERFADLISLHLDLQQQLVASEQDLQQERELATFREQFIAVLGHDLRNPLQAIVSSAETLALAPTEEPEELVSVIQQSCARMEQIIADVLDFTRGRLGGGIHIAAQTEVDVAQVIESVIAESRAAWPGRQLHLQMDVSGSVRCDPMRIAQLLSNLVANAVMHGDEAAPVTVHAWADAGALELRVTNKGPPIPAEIRPKLFQPFSRSYSDERRSGLGLGLYICAEITRAHQGTLDFSSDEHQTRFTFSMPTFANAQRSALPSADSIVTA